MSSFIASYTFRFPIFISRLFQSPGRSSFMIFFTLPLQFLFGLLLFIFSEEAQFISEYFSLILSTYPYQISFSWTSYKTVIGAFTISRILSFVILCNFESPVNIHQLCLESRFASIEYCIFIDGRKYVLVSFHWDRFGP